MSLNQPITGQPADGLADELAVFANSLGDIELIDDDELLLTIFAATGVVSGHESV